MISITRETRKSERDGKLIGIGGLRRVERMKGKDRSIEGVR